MVQLQLFTAPVCNDPSGGTHYGHGLLVAAVSWWARGKQDAAETGITQTTTCV